MEWNAALYDKKHDFVAEYGKNLLEFIPENPGQAILDLGCGTGTLTAQLAGMGGRVIGVDCSPSMIEKARKQYEHLEFRVCDALALPFEPEFDVVFSNAVFHWIGNHDLLLKNICHVLKPQGLLVCEFGARGNIKKIENAFAKACLDFGVVYQSKFHFPAAEDFGKLLEQNGFLPDMVSEYARPTLLKDGEAGLANWLEQFFAVELAAMPEIAREMIVREVEEFTRDTLWNGEGWVADYRRLRAVARKSGR